MKRIIFIGLISFTCIINSSCIKSDESNSVTSDIVGCVECEKKKLQVQLSEPLIITNPQDSLVLALYNCIGFKQYNGRKFGEVKGKKVQVSDIIDYKGKVIFIEINKSANTSKWLIAMMFPDRIEMFVHEVNIGTDTFRLNEYYLDGTLFLSGLVNKSNGRFISVSGSNLKSTQMTWSGCMKTAYNACQDDWQCSILCGLMFPSCVGSMAVACAYTVAK